VLVVLVVVVVVVVVVVLVVVVVVEVVVLLSVGKNVTKSPLDGFGGLGGRVGRLLLVDQPQLSSGSDEIMLSSSNLSITLVCVGK